MHRHATAFIALSIAFLACAGALVTPSWAGDGVTTYYAVLVGIADFQGTGSDLNYTDDDAIDMQAALLASNNWAPDNIQLILDRDATRDAIQTAIAWMLTTSDDDDVILFFMSSHGTQGPDVAPLDEPDGMDEYLCTTNFLDIRDDELGQWFSVAQTPHVLVMIDTCFSGGNIKDLPPGAKVKSINPNPPAPGAGNGIAEDILRGLAKVQTKDLDDNAVGVVLTACDGDELSVESAQWQNGLFTEYLLEAILDIGLGYPADVSANEWVSGEEAFNYLAPLVVSQYPFQNPQLFDADDTYELDFVGVADTPPQPPRVVSAFDTPDDEGGSITVVWSKSRDDGRGQNDVTGYTVLRAPSATGPFTSLQSLPAGSTIHVDSGATDGTNYWYRVDVHDPLYTSSSDVAGPAQSRDDLAPDPIVYLFAEDCPADQGGSVTVYWNGYQTPPDFDHYNVYRSESSFTNITDDGVTKVATITEVGKQYYWDKTTQDGTQYWFAATAVDDTKDIVTPNGNENPEVTAVGPAISSPNFMFSYPPGVSIIAIGAQTQETGLAALLGIPAATLTAARYDPSIQDYHRYADNPADPYLTQALGRAFWLSTADPVSVSVSGQPAPAGDFSAPFLPDWNMIGNPYTVDTDVTGMTVDVGGEVMTLAEAARRGWTRDYMWGYDAFMRSYVLISPTIQGDFVEKRIRKGRGVFFRAFVSGKLVLPRPGDAAVPTRLEPAQLDAVTVDWQMRLVAESAAGADVDNFVGASSQAAALNAITSPPMQGIDLYFEQPEGVRAAASFVQPGAPGLTCAVKVASAQAGSVTLRWPDLTGVPNDLKPVLVDVATGKRIYMRTATHYAYDADADGVREFRLEIAPCGGGALAVRTMAVTPAPVGTQVVFTLTKDAKATVEVLNIAGRKVKTLASGVDVAGATTTTLAWDGRSAWGLRVPAGRYLVRVTAVADDGQNVSAARAVMVGR